MNVQQFIFLEKSVEFDTPGRRVQYRCCHHDQASMDSTRLIGDPVFHNISRLGYSWRRPIVPSIDMLCILMRTTKYVSDLALHAALANNTRNIPCFTM